jgi:hypothetical protein
VAEAGGEDQDPEEVNSPGEVEEVAEAELGRASQGVREHACSAYKQSRDALKTEIEHVNIISLFDQSEPASTLYFEHIEHAFVTNSNSNCAVDSGAICYFSGYIQDSPSLERWLVPKAVRLANRSIFEALDTGILL